MNIRPLTGLIAIVVALTAAAGAQAVLGGGLDAGRHPAAGALLIPGTDGLVPECSGVLVSSRVFLTAAHCTDAALAADGAYVAFGETLDPASRQPIHGTPVSDPAYGHDSADPQDLGVILLDRAAPVKPAAIGSAEGVASVVTVGFGYSQRTDNKDFVYDGAKHSATIPVSSQTSTLLRLSSQTGVALCFGDSGGPQYAGTAVVSVTSGGNSVCKGNATATRLDSASARSFLAQYVQLPS